MTIVKAKSARVKHVRVRAFAIAERTPPAEVQLWSAGANPTDYGIHYFTEQSAANVMARYNERGNLLLVDVEHSGAVREDDGEPSVTGGYAKLEIRDGAPWLIFDWSAYGVDQISSGQRRYLSPEYDVDADTNEITKLYRVSLVADPGTHRARVLASAASLPSVTSEGVQMDSNLAAIVALLDSVSDPAAAVDAVRGYLANLPSSEAVPSEVVDEPVNADAGPAKADDKPAFAAASDDDKKKVEAAAPVAASAPAPVSSVDARAVETVRAHALQGENALRDIILMKDGHRLAPSVRTWASSQSLAVVRGLCAAAPDAVEPATRVAATRGATQGTGASTRGLQGHDLEVIQRAAGTFKASSPSFPHRDENGNYVYPTVPPAEFRRIQAAAAAKGGAK